jgi:TetR/AcrR family transcriptional regulator, cholesterol catabolism regulator
LTDDGVAVGRAAGSGIGRRRSAAREDATASYQRRRKEIGAAAVRVFNRLGFQGASITAVAEELGIDRASLYYYISSKEELFDEVLREVVERNFHIVERIRTSNTSPRRKLREAIIALMNSYGEHYPLFYIYIRENLSHVSDKRSQWSREMRRLNRITEGALIAIIEEGFADGSFRKVGSARVVANGVFGVIGWTHRWYRPERSEVSVAEIGYTYAEMILSGLESPGESPPASGRS